MFKNAVTTDLRLILQSGQGQRVNLRQKEGEKERK
jgi:hypothetical protein